MVNSRDEPDTVFAGYPAGGIIWLIQKPDTGYLGRARYRISGWILGLTPIFLVKYQINL
jgi:hypothetical protein